MLQGTCYMLHVTTVIFRLVMPIFLHWTVAYCALHAIVVVELHDELDATVFFLMKLDASVVSCTF